jgi:Zn-dependent peptidase ImmA (M78 family)
LAVAIRRLVGVRIEDQFAWTGEYAPLNEWRDAVEGAGVLVFHFSRVSTEEARGFSLSERPLPVVSLNGSDSPNGRVFTLMHELAHLFIGEGGACNLREGSRALTSPNARVEILCNAAAAEALVPEDVLRAQDVVDTHGTSPTWSDGELLGLARAFGVSTEVILRRLLELGRTTDEFYRTRRDEWARAPRRGGGGPISQAQLAIRNAGKRFARSVLDAYSADRITGPEASSLLGVKLKHLPEIDRRLAGANVLTGSDR